MFGISSFSEAPFSGLVVTEAGGWQEIRGDSNSWVDQSTISYFPVRASNGIGFECSLTVLSSNAIGYIVGFTILNSEGTGFVRSIDLWQNSSTSSNVWV